MGNNLVNVQFAGDLDEGLCLGDVEAIESFDDTQVMWLVSKERRKRTCSTS
jgi:hypothetical protein